MSRNRCPKCEGALQHAEQAGLPTARCAGCEGTWLDVAELEHLAYGVAAAHEVVEAFTQLAVQELPPGPHSCPGCGQPLVLGSYGGVEVDVCRRCRGLYFDRFELASVLDPRAGHPCPKCAAPMGMGDGGDVPTHACPGCGGRWISVPVLEYLVDPSRSARLASAALVRTFASVRRDDARPTTHACPTCRGTLLACDHQGVELDFCFQCRGLFLDRGETEAVTRLHSTRSDRALAAVASGPGRALDALVSAVGSLLS